MLKPTRIAAHSTGWLILPAALSFFGVVMLAVAPTLAILVLFAAAGATLAGSVRVEVGNGWAVCQCTRGAALMLVASAAGVIVGAVPLRLQLLIEPYARALAEVARGRAQQVVAALESKLQVVHACIHCARVLTARGAVTAS